VLSKRGETQFINKQIDASLINVRHAITHHETESAYELMQNADAIVMVFPLTSSAAGHADEIFAGFCCEKTEI
jgi:hypothetical protein